MLIEFLVRNNVFWRVYWPYDKRLLFLVFFIKQDVEVLRYDVHCHSIVQILFCNQGEILKYDLSQEVLFNVDSILIKELHRNRWENQVEVSS